MNQHDSDIHAIAAPFKILSGILSEGLLYLIFVLSIPFIFLWQVIRWAMGGEFFDADKRFLLGKIALITSIIWVPLLIYCVYKFITYIIKKRAHDEEMARLLPAHHQRVREMQKQIFLAIQKDVLNRIYNRVGRPRTCIECNNPVWSEVFENSYFDTEEDLNAAVSQHKPGCKHAQIMIDNCKFPVFHGFPDNDMAYRGHIYGMDDAHKYNIEWMGYWSNPESMHYSIRYGKL